VCVVALQRPERSATKNEGAIFEIDRGVSRNISEALEKIAAARRHDEASKPPPLANLSLS
jgi:hypothetical protein